MKTRSSDDRAQAAAVAGQASLAHVLHHHALTIPGKIARARVQVEARTAVGGAMDGSRRNVPARRPGDLHEEHGP
ncbi:hypothetical protein [Roseococcus microcysteis]|uniref:hypothetical protein n=1 Tax=Roseococcus microcysteis TaxID=2771361 RepID=UPI00168A48D3|nr:hypothetical protein [Roseococcus microcysteis]